MPKSNKGFTLTEILVVVLIFGVGVGLFNTIFINNWAAYEDRIARANLWNQANQFFEQLSFEARNASKVDLVITDSKKAVLLTNAGDDPTITSFILSNDGNLSQVKSDLTKIISTHVVFLKSNFKKSDKSLIVDLQLVDSVFGRNIHLAASTEVFLRN